MHAQKSGNEWCTSSLLTCLDDLCPVVLLLLILDSDKSLLGRHSMVRRRLLV